MPAEVDPGKTNKAEVRPFGTLYRLLAALNQARAFDEVYASALTSLLEVTAAGGVAILLPDENGAMRFHAARGLSREYQAAAEGQAFAGAHPIVIPDVLAAETLSEQRDALQQEDIRALALIPLPLARTPGTFALYYPEPHECSVEELEIAQTIAGHVATAIEQKRMEVERTFSEHSWHVLAAIVESSEDAIVSKDLNGIITSWNQGAERIFGYTAADVVGQPVSMLAAPDRLDEMPTILSKIRQGQRVEHYETRRRAKDGRIIDVALTVSPVRNSGGQIIGASKIARDITDRKQAEKERALLLAREQENRRTAELLNQVGPRLAAQLDFAKLVQEVTDIASALIGAEFGSFLQNADNEKGEPYTLNAHSGMESDAAPGLVLTADVFSAGVIRYEDASQAPGVITEGQSRIRSYLAVPVVARSGEVLGRLFFGHSQPGRFTENHAVILTGIAAQAAIAMDNARLFEQAQWAQTELKRSNEELRRANRDLEMFAYSASHDLQEPLRTIAISAQLIDRSWGQKLADREALFLGDILSAAKRMGLLIEDLLAYTRATKYEEGPAPRVDSSCVLTEVLKNMRASITEAGANVTAGELPAVAIHERRLAQLFQNLISNAIKYHRDEAPRIHVAADQKDGWCVFSVMDNGIGIDLQFAERIFGLFKRLHGRDEYPGSGIGLAICQRVVEQYGGSIWLERSELGRGSTFCFSLPSRT